MGSPIPNCSAIGPATHAPAINPAPPGPFSDRRFYRLHLAPPLVRARRQQRSPRPRTRSGRFSIIDNDNGDIIVTSFTEHDVGASPSVLPNSPPRIAMEPRKYWLEYWHRFGYGGSRNPECAVESSPVNSHDSHDDDRYDTSRGAIATHVPLVATQQCAALITATATCRPARLSHDTALAPWWRAPTRIPTRSRYQDATHRVAGANARLEWRHYCRGCKCGYGRRCAVAK